MSRNRILGGAAILVILVILGYAGYQNFLAPIPAAPTAQAQADSGQSSPSVISAEGRVVPARYVRLSFNTGGVIGEALVSEGDAVQAGQTLLRLESYSQFQAGVAAANLQLVAARQAYDSLFEGLDIQRALALKAVADGRDAVRDAVQRLDNLESPADQTDIDQARANQTLAQNNLDKAEDAFEPYRNKPEDNLVRAARQSALAQAQQIYDAALRLVNNLEGIASEIDIGQAEADMEVAKARLAEAEREYAELGGGPAPDELELAEARLNNAEVQLAAAEDALAQQELRAAFDGTVVSLVVKVGEYAPPGIPVVVIADLSLWRIETTDLSENDVALLLAGLTATITIDAFAGQTFAGSVLEVGLRGEDSRGAVTYAVLLSFDSGDIPVRWGMMAFVDIEIE